MASDRFSPIPLDQLLRIVLNQYQATDQIFGIPRRLFYSPNLLEPFRTQRFEHILETPIGVAAGPHTQMAQNIVAAWLTGARFIELKTIQTLDELEISKPCIDMQDEGYNCEWSQELKVHQSFEQYLDAWILIHILKDRLSIGDPRFPGVIFNMSVGYNLEGIMNENVQWFFQKMSNASEMLELKLKSVETIYPKVRELSISPKISDNVTLSTMHGCPPDEIERIGLYLLKEKKIHTTIKLNPTLLGEESLQRILSRSGFETLVPDIAFEHDLKYADALNIIRNLTNEAKANDLHFGIKLTNTLESINHKEVFPPNEKMMYMSGRALHPISVNLAAKLQNDFGGKLDISFCGGADTFNVSSLIACGLSPITVCSDILKPGGYGRLSQYIESIRQSFDEVRASSIEDFIKKESGSKGSSLEESIIYNLNNYAIKVIENELYKKTTIKDPSIKTPRPLSYFDCIHAPCEDTCPTNQDIPSYNYHASQGDISKAGDIILQTNPFPQTTGMICDHLCQTKCTRINYDSPVLIREIKRYIAEVAIATRISKEPDKITPGKHKRVAIIGAGPSGLSCAYFLVLAGFHVEVFESKKQPGGMVSGVIPSFRLTDQAINNDIERIKALGVGVHFGITIGKEIFSKLKGEFDYVYIAAGAQKSSKLALEGIDSLGVFDPLKLLEMVKNGDIKSIGKRVVIIGGGNTAMDVARTVLRMVEPEGKVTIVYRRTIKEMPADLGEIKAVIEEGVEVLELTAPERINTENLRAVSITCSRMELGPKDSSGRRSPKRIPNSEFSIEADTIIPAVGQELAFDFGLEEPLKSKPGEFETQLPNTFLGGDALRGASTAINAIGDGRKVAQLIIEREGIPFVTKPQNLRNALDIGWHLHKRTRKTVPATVKETSLSNRKNFDLVASTLSEDDVISEASRCLLCDEFCSVCATVCPNIANFTYSTIPSTFQVQQVARMDDGGVEIKNHSQLKIIQPFQILNIANFCNECGNCNTFCPSGGAPYIDKPKVYLTKSSFDENSDGFLLEHSNGSLVLHWKEGGKVKSLENDGTCYRFNTEDASATLGIDGLSIETVVFNGEKLTPFSNQDALVMSLVMKGIEQYLGKSIN